MLRLNTKIFLDDTRETWLELYQIEDPMSGYTKDFTKYWALKPFEKGWVKVLNKATSQYVDKQIYRSYENYLHTPAFDPTTKKSFMFNGAGFKELPAEYQPFYEELLTLTPTYNQVVVNYYQDGTEFIEPHSDCTAKFIEPTSSIAIITLNESHPRFMQFEARSPEDPSFELSLENGSVLVMGGRFQQKYRHGIAPEPDNGSKRISITVRQMKVQRDAI